MTCIARSGRWLATVLLAFQPQVHADGALRVTLPPGTAIELRFVDAITSASAIQGQHFKLAVEHDVLQQGRILVPRGTAAVGTILDAEPSGRAGAGGTLSIKLDYLQLGPQRVRLHWTLSSTDRSRERKAMMLNGLLVGLGTSTQGKEIEVAAGTQITATTKDPVEIAVAPSGASAVVDVPPVSD
jgi:hypothetical protein